MAFGDGFCPEGLRRLYTINVDLGQNAVLGWSLPMPMEGMRDLLKEALGRSLSGLQAEDKLAAAWPVVCGRALAERGTVVGYADGMVHVEVTDGAWLRQMMSMQGQLSGEMGRISGVQVRGIHFEVKGQKKRATVNE
jgi:Dna[CI] antecedent, DciA